MRLPLTLTAHLPSTTTIDTELPDSASAFTIPDWTVLGIYLCALLFTGIIFAKKETKNTKDYFLGSRTMPSWAVAISIVATSLSAVTFIGAPESSYNGNLTYLATNIGMILASIIIAWKFIPVFYSTGSASIYEFLEHRYSPAARTAASITFLFGRSLASGARIYVGAIPASILIFGIERGTENQNIMIAIVLLTFVGITYTLAGGIRSVIWSDVIQYGVLLAAALFAIILISNSFNAPFSQIIHELRTGLPDDESKLTLIDTKLDFTSSFSIFACFIGFTLLGIGSYGTDQDLAQRMLTCKSSLQGARSVIIGILLGIPTVSIFLIVGSLLWIVYQRPELTDLPPITQTDDSVKVFLHYILTQVPPGVRGLMMAGLFAAGLSSLNSAINAMSAAFLSDIYRPLLAQRNAPLPSEKHFLFIGKAGVVFWGLILGLFAIMCIYWKQHNNDMIIDFALGVMGIAYAGLIGIFFTAILTKRGSTRSIITALIVGFLWMSITQPFVFRMFNTQPTPDQTTSSLFESIEFVYSIHFTWKLTIGVLLTTTIAMIGNQPSSIKARWVAPREA